MNILITGATSGIGQQLSKDYLLAGHQVIVCGRNQDVLQQLQQEFSAQVNCKSFDITDLKQCRQVLSDLPALDLVILNAGTCEYIDALHFDAEVFERVIRTNLIGLANCLDAILPFVKHGGRLAIMGSSSSYLPLPRAEAYGASKAATEYLAKTLAITLRRKSVAVSYIAPGFVETPLTGRNDFPMPMMVSPKQASTAIIKGLHKGKREIHFPRRFTWLLKFTGALPGQLQLWLIRHLVA